MMIGYDEYENMIVKRLQMPDVDVLPLPLLWVLNKERSVNNPRVYVIFAGSAFEDTDRLGDYSQWDTLSFKLVIEARTRDGKHGIFSVAEEAIERLLKWDVPDATQNITLSSFSYTDGVQNNWQYQLAFSFQRVRIRREPEPDDKLIKEITFNDHLNVKQTKNEEI